MPNQRTCRKIPRQSRPARANRRRQIATICAGIRVHRDSVKKNWKTAPRRRSGASALPNVQPLSSGNPASFFHQRYAESLGEHSPRQHQKRAQHSTAPLYRHKAGRVFAPSVLSSAASTACNSTQDAGAGRGTRIAMPRSAPRNRTSRPSHDRNSALCRSGDAES